MRLALLALIVTILAVATPSTRASPQRRLTVCADPNNLPFSNRAGQGFENKIIQLVARDMQAKVDYLWWAQRRGYVRNTLAAGRCDLWPGVASGVKTVATTRPYYRSSYVFVTRADRRLGGLTLDDKRLGSLSIGVQMIGQDGMNTPPAHAIASRGLVDHVRGFMLYGNYERPNPPADIVDAVISGQIDVAIVWGPLAGFFAHRSSTPLRLEPVPQGDGEAWPMAYDISMGVRRDDSELRRQLDAVLERDKPQIEALLRAYHVPEVLPAAP